ncbi:hypothetical protein ACWEVP_11175 [Amycolatopsis sp. NPDC003865]
MHLRQRPLAVRRHAAARARPPDRAVSRVGLPQYEEGPIIDVEGVPDGYRAMAGREALKVLIKP